MAHDHGSQGAQHRGQLLLVLALTASYMVVEAVAGFMTGSLVLVADAGHMLTDVAGLTLALSAIWFAQRPATQQKTYGYYRAEILAALANALLLFGVSAYIFFEAYRRFLEPLDVPSVPLLIVASVGLGVNLVGARVLMGGARKSLNVRGAFLEVVSDILGSLGAIATGVILLTTGWRYADPLFAAAVGLFILPRTWRLMKGAIDVLLEGTPEGMDVGVIQQEILALPGVTGLHDLHVWMVTSGFVAMSGHVLVRDEHDRDETLVRVRTLLHDEFGVDHVTVQVETERLAERLQQPCFPGSSPCYADSGDGARPAEPSSVEAPA
jgi:cobalt-zinc-cadmium efflux system protein